MKWQMEGRWEADRRRMGGEWKADRRWMEGKCKVNGRYGENVFNRRVRNWGLGVGKI